MSDAATHIENACHKVEHKKNVSGDCRYGGKNRAMRLHPPAPSLSGRDSISHWGQPGVTKPRQPGVTKPRQPRLSRLGHGSTASRK